MRWNTSDRCVTCKATGDLIDDPIYAGLCGECGEECCARCGLVEGDVEGNTWICGPCRDANDLQDNEPTKGCNDMPLITETNAKDLKASLKAVSPAIGKSSIAALEAVLLGNGRIVATDMACQIDAPCVGADFNPVLIPAANLKKVLGALKPTDSVTMSAIDDGVLIVSQHGATTLPGIDVADFPTWASDERDGIALHELDPAATLASILKVSSIAGTDESRPVLMATLLASTAGKLDVVSTDSYRLAADSVLCSSDDIRVLIPSAAKYLKHASGIDYIEASINLSKSESGSAFARMADEASGVVYSFRCADGRFPDHRQLVPSSWEQVVELPADIDSTLAYIAEAVIKRNEPVRLGFDADGLTVSASVQDGPKHAKTFALACDWDHEYMTIGANADYLRDGLALMGANPRFSMISPLRPMLLTDGSSLQYLLMPVRLPA